MSIFGKIKDAIFGQKASAQEAAPAPRSAPRESTPFNRPAPTAMDEVDVEQRLDAMEGADKLNWRTSIVDLMKLVDLDPSFDNRKELAHEMGDADYSGKAEENIWLHGKVMDKLAENGGRVPSSLRS
ncbi:DUF3597 domain-containing protein [Aurantiacibacter spongiae]|uniref:DUF3597 domain-containing protein n=1 Tax=Aurantiacibacter spongiae TaxID=2488860 RepID=A0A3N5CP49_9SPHN|nr:DUF3597 domain-containing protein [Aurantiacibacter spongiae]RPF70357.1 DUF3597 domain-containing protein [Aurantiacibacter spongiae]